MLYTGIDYHRSFSYLTTMNEKGEVKLSHPLKTKAIAYAKVKTDKVDSATLAHLLRSSLPPLSYVPEKSIRLKVNWEEELLRQYLKGKMDIDELARLIEHTPRAILEKVKRMGLYDSKKTTKRLKVNWEDKSSLPLKNHYFYAGSRHEPMSLRLLR